MTPAHRPAPSSARGVDLRGAGGTLIAARGACVRARAVKDATVADDLFRTAQGPRLVALLDPRAMVRGLWGHRELILRLAHRDIVGRYRAAHLGLLWSVITPLVLLAIYTFVFTAVFHARWNAADVPETRGAFALTMFCGMLLFNLFAEVATRAPFMVVANPNYVKKVVFPLEVFAVSGLLSALFNLAIGLGVWLVGWFLIMGGLPPATMAWLPVVLVPVCLVTLAAAWVLASVGVFVRDIGPAVTLGVQILFFVTPIFYRVEQIPMPYRRLLEINPLTHAVADARRVLMWGESPAWAWWAASTVVSAVLAVVAYAFFVKSKRAFGDVL